MAWKYWVMKGLHNLGIKDRLPQLIDGFLSKRKFRVCIDSTLSGGKNQEEGIPLGSILSVTFNIKINNVIKELSSGIDGSLYVDDLICFKSKYIHTIEQKLQQTKENQQIGNSKWIQVLYNNNSVSILSQEKKKKKTHNDFSLKLDGSEFPAVDEYKFLGIIFDKKLTFIPHLNGELIETLYCCYIDHQFD